MPSTPVRVDLCVLFLICAAAAGPGSAAAQAVDVESMEVPPRAREAAILAAPYVAPAPTPRTTSSADQTSDAALQLAREGARLYMRALAADPDAELALFAEALARFERIARDYGETPLARAVADGRVGMIDISALRALVATLEIPAAPSALAATATPAEEAGPETGPQTGPETRTQSVAPDAGVAALFEARASVAAAHLCREPIRDCHARMVAAARSWFDALAPEASRAVAGLVLAPPAPDEAERVVADDAATRLWMFEEIVGARGDALRSLAAALGDLAEQTVFASPAGDAASVESDAADALASAFMTLTASAALHPDDRAARSLPDMAAAHRRKLGRGVDFAFSWAASSFSQDLIRRSLGAGPVPQALAAQSARQHERILAALSRGETVGAMLGAATPRALTPAESDFLEGLLSLDAATRANLILAAPQTPVAERIEVYAEWVSGHAHAVSGRMLAADMRDGGRPAGLP